MRNINISALSRFRDAPDTPVTRSMFPRENEEADEAFLVSSSCRARSIAFRDDDGKILRVMEMVRTVVLYRTYSLHSKYKR